MAVGAAAASPAIGAVRRKGVSDILHCMLLRSVERERQAAIATPVSPTRRQQFDHLLIKGHGEDVIAIRLPTERRPSHRAGLQTDNQVWQVLAAATIGRKAYDFRLARDRAGGRRGCRSKTPTRAPACDSEGRGRRLQGSARHVGGGAGCCGGSQTGGRGALPNGSQRQDGVPAHPQGTKQHLDSEALGPDLERLRREVEEVNTFAGHIDVGGGLPPRWKRVFTVNASLGGRWTAVGREGVYQTMPEVDRPSRITIAGEPVAELDVSACQLFIVQGLLRLPLPEGDLMASLGSPAMS